MKNILLATILLLGSIVFGQNFTYNQEGLIPKFLVVDVPNKTQSELYNTALNWIKDNYNTPSEVIKSTIENERIRFEGISKSILFEKNLGISMLRKIKYIIEISFKDDKFKFEPIAMFLEGSNLTFTPVFLEQGGDHNFMYYKPNGDVRKVYRLYPENISNELNSVKNSLVNYIEKGADKTANEDW